MHPTKALTFVTMAVLVAAGASTGCATKKFVRTEVGAVNDKVETVSKTLEETQERTRKNEVRIAEVDQKADQVSKAASTADSKAVAADTHAGAAMNRADDVDKNVRAMGSLMYSVVLNEAQGNFKIGKAALPDEATGQLDQLISQLKGSSTNAYIQIEGHTDSTGDLQYNRILGLQRAEAVRQYLYDHYQVPLHRMNVISFGEDKPVAPNTTRDGRALNRRVVIQVVNPEAKSMTAASANQTR
jgi:peptidoglycan-associated lipoprotein